MLLNQLALVNFRNYRRLGLDLGPGVLVFCGQNGQGKTNLLEAVYVLATTKSPRTSTERELVSWRAGDEDPDAAGLIGPFARLEARVYRSHGGEAHLEIVFKGEPREAPLEAEEGIGEHVGPLSRSISVNGLSTRASGLLGQLTVVYFAPEDVGLAGGPPTGRRRYLDLANSQVAPLYLRALQQYNRVLLQRNHVLRRIRERRQPMSALEPWTDHMVRTGAFILRHRLQMVAGLNERVVRIFRELAGSGGELTVAYHSTAGVADRAPADVDDTAHVGTLGDAFRERQTQLAGREVEQAASLVGPHRDDFAFMLDGVDLNVYGSRGQQRLAVLALKLAEADWMLAETGDLPVVLLDDVLSELDAQKRRYVMERVMQEPVSAVAAERQVWITTTDFGAVPPELLARARRFYVDAGTVRPA